MPHSKATVFAAAAAAVLSLAVASPAGAAVPKIQPLTIVPGFSIGNVEVGMSKAKAYAAWGKPDVCRTDQYKTTTCEYKPKVTAAQREVLGMDYPVAKFKLRSGKVITASVYTTPNQALSKQMKRLRTSKRIGLGSMLPAARRAYGLPPGSGGEAGITRARVVLKKRCTLFYAGGATMTVPDAPINWIEVGLCTTNHGNDGGL